MSDEQPYQRVTMNPHVVMRDVDAMVREIQRHACKARNLTEMVRAAKNEQQRDQHAQALVRRLDRLTAAAGPAFLTQWRQAVLPPREPQQPPGPPDDLICKKCALDKPLHEFFYDDGHGSYGYTRRCAGCRRSGRRTAK